MKKLALVLAVSLVTCASSFAQYQPEAGTVTTEIQFNPFNQDGENFSIDGLKLRYFFNEKHALRLNLGFGVGSNKYSDDGVNETTDEKWSTDLKSKTGNFTLGLGYEYHINVAPRFSVYVGGETGFTVTTAKTKINGKTGSDETDVTIKNYYTNDVENGMGNFDPTDPFNGISPTGAFTYNLQALTGFDFYMYKGLYCGAEFGLQFRTTKYKNLGIEGKVAGTDIKSEDFEDTAKRTSLSLAFKAVTAIRLGWKF